ncbi:GIY-YIG nuclease family protein [Vibrio mangrovi]|uniref:GIY-YIG nuclease family protein n=1 Tax=Vibrio mangrovi TaxID=474394 RepID=A0A1Y6IT79_9VIBR|nr:GIY-YIG nuclease family protein [Vibrio mangrovi]MDW6004579.1 GIY-YIG nuclease family protein [Vibrio mangrovi]SMS00867.1 GIY-YIG nuclease superfamily protein [Vibrio mangrovi]
MTFEHQAEWWIYFVRTPQNALYCGITTDITRRFRQHQCGQGAKALRGKSPLQLVWSHPVGTHREALQMEARVKRLSKVRKEKIVIKNLLPSQIFDH